MKKVSIIVPVYNSCEIISRCIESILQQTYYNLEILIIDDGSTDGSVDICREYELKHKRITFIPSSHAGVSLVRNIGLDKVTGDYVMFVDGDDYVKKTYVEKMVAGIEKESDCDMCICSYERVIYGGLYPIKPLQKAGIYSKVRYLKNTLKDPGHHYFGVLWNKIFKTEFIRKENIRFNKDISLGEDFVFSLEYLRNAKKVNVINDKLYLYCYQEKSTLSRIHKKTVSDCLNEMENRNRIFDSYVRCFKNVGAYDGLEKRIYHYWVVFYIRQSYSLGHEYKWPLKEKENWMNLILINPNIDKALKIYTTKEIRAESLCYLCKQTIKDFMKNTVKAVKTTGRRQEG